MNHSSAPSHLYWFILLFFLTPIVAVTALSEHALESTVLLWSVESAFFLFLSIDSGTNQEVTQELANIQYHPMGSSSLEKGVSEARETLDTQVENLNDIDTKAIRILRINVLLIGLILSALTFSANNPIVPFRRFLNVYLGTGIFLLIGSSATAGLTYTSSDSRAGVSKPNITTMLREDLTAEELNLVLSKSYAKWIRENQSTEILNSFFSTSTILLLIYAVTYLALGVYHGLVDPVPLPLEGASNVALLTITLASGYPNQIRRVVGELDLWVD
ncbi:hypothetical protein [Halorussus litoreus]|uniref:hypothetical protein n=1 Tax=Halorussus litoreus TaxID=1710536 RepID=UPI000E28666A|nr:hypothetical protein [Halorussus litoreus]